MLGWQNTALIASGALAAALAWGEWRHYQGKQVGRAAVQAELTAAAERVRERLRDADTGSGDPDADLCWLAQRMRLVPPPGCE